MGQSKDSLNNCIKTQRKAYRSGKLSEDRCRLLDSIGFVVYPQDEQWERGYEAARHYYQEYGDLEIPTVYETKDGYNLGEWLRKQRRSARSGALSGYRTDRLDALDIGWRKREVGSEASN